MPRGGTGSLRKACGRSRPTILKVRSAFDLFQATVPFKAHPTDPGQVTPRRGKPVSPAGAEVPPRIHWVCSWSSPVDAVYWQEPRAGGAPRCRFRDRNPVPIQSPQQQYLRDLAPRSAHARPAQRLRRERHHGFPCSVASNACVRRKRVVNRRQPW